MLPKFLSKMAAGSIASSFVPLQRENSKEYKEKKISVMNEKLASRAKNYNRKIIINIFT